MKQRVIIIGGGLSGLSSAIHLATAGYQVSILEKNQWVGGQINQIIKNQTRLDLSNHILTLPETLTELFDCVGKSPQDYLTLQSIEPQWRTFFQDGLSIDFSGDQSKLEGHLHSTKRFKEYLDLCKRMHHLSMEQVSSSLSPSLFQRIKWSIRQSKQTVSEIHHRFLNNPYLEQMFNFFALLEGQSPDHAPAPFTLHMIYSQLYTGLYQIEGGFYHFVEVLVRLLYELGVEIRTEATVTKILTECFEVVGVELADRTQLPADIILSSLNPVTTYQDLLRDFSRQEKLMREVKSKQPSLSAHLLFIHVKKSYDQLTSNNLFLSSQPEKELHELFTKKQPAEDPTVWVSLSQPPQTSEGQILTLFSHVPALKAGQDWSAYRKSFYASYRRRVITKLESMGLQHLERNISWEREITPDELQTDLGSLGGSIYGLQSKNPKQRASYQSKELGDLYFIGSSVAYGHSIPMILQSSKQITQQIILEHKDPS